MAASTALMTAISARRTFYHLGNQSTIPDAKIEELIKDTLRHVPSAFNTQTTRIVLLLNDEHRKLWTFTTEAMKGMVPEDQIAATEERMGGFKAAHGTVILSPAIHHFLGEKVD